MPSGKMSHTLEPICLNAKICQTHTYTHSHTELTTDDTILPWQAWCQVDVCPLHAAQALLLDGGPVTEVGAMNSFCRTVLRTSQDRFQLQILHLATARVHRRCLNQIKKQTLLLHN